jgi:hypothetical protein
MLNLRTIFLMFFASRMLEDSYPKQAQVLRKTASHLLGGFVILWILGVVFFFGVMVLAPQSNKVCYFRGSEIGIPDKFLHPMSCSLMSNYPNLRDKNPEEYYFQNASNRLSQNASR